MATETVTIKITSTGAVTVKKEITDIGTAAKGASANVDFMRNALAGVAAYLSVSTFVKYADAATQVSNSLKLAGLSGQEFLRTQDALYNAAISNGQSTEALAAIYLKMSAASKQLGMNNEQMTGTIEGIAAAMRLSTAGTNAQEGALQQLSQLLGGTMVQAQEYNSLVDGAYPLLQAAALGSSKWAGSVAKLTADVKSSNVSVKEFVAALQIGLPQIEAQAAGLPLTVGAAFRALGEAFQYWVATSSQASVVGGIMSNAIMLIARNINVVIPAVAAIGAAMAANFGINFITSLAANVTLFTQTLLRLGTMILTTIIPAIVSFVVQITAMGLAFVTALPGVIATTAAFVAANASFIAVTAVLVTVAAGVAYLLDLLLNGGQAFQSFEQAAVTAVNNVKTTFSSIMNFLGNGTANITVTAQQAAQQLLQASTNGAQQYNQNITQSSNQGGKQMADNIVSAAKDVADPIKTGISDGVQTAVDSINTSIADAGQTMATTLTTAGTTMSTAWNTALIATAGQMTTTMTTGLTQWSTSFIQQATQWGNSFVQAFSSAAQNAANAIRSAAASAAGPGPGGPAFAGGGQFRVGGSGGTDSQRVSFRASPNERVTIETPKQQRQNDAAAKAAPAQAAAPGRANIINSFDPQSMIDAMGSRAGRNAQINFIKSNRAEIARALGI